MKKNLLFLLTGLSIMLLLGGCRNKDGNTDGTEKNTYVLSDHIKLGQYKGIEVEVIDLEVTEEQIDEEIEYELLLLRSTVEITDRDVVEEGDTANIDFKGILDGVAFPGGTAEDYDLVIGSGSFIEGFEEQLIGVKVGDTAELDLKFPEEYHSQDLAGKDVVFEVTVNKIFKEQVPELTDELVQEAFGYDTIEEYRESVRIRLEKENEETIRASKTRQIFDIIIENAEIYSYPQTLIDSFVENYTKEYEMYAISNGMQLEEFLSNVFNMSMDDFNVELREWAEEVVEQQLVVEAIAEAEGIELSEEEFNEGVTRLKNEYNFNTEEEFIEYYGEDTIRETLLWEKVLDFVTAHAIEV